jgi:hypothetical protein
MTLTVDESRACQRCAGRCSGAHVVEVGVESVKTFLKK